MKYAEMRDRIKTGDVLAWSEGGPWTSWRNVQLNLVRMGTMSDFNHVGLAYCIGGRVFVVEAVVPYIRIYPLSRELPFFWIPTPYVFDLAAETTMLEKVGLPYSKWEAVKALFTTDTDGGKAWECAKLVNRTLMQFDSGFDALHDTPAEVVKYLTRALGFQLSFVSD